MNISDLPEGHETVLVVDDHEIIWDFMIDALQQLGYTVILAEDGDDAVEIYQCNPKQIDIVILDMLMPRKNGNLTFAELQKIDPAVCVLLTSGFVSEDDVTDLLKSGAAGFLPKPYRLRDVAVEIRRALDEKRQKNG